MTDVRREIVSMALRERDEARSSRDEAGIDRDRALAERDAALAVIERVLNLIGDVGPEARRILTQSPTDALAEHDALVKAEALDEAAVGWTGGPGDSRMAPIAQMIRARAAAYRARAAEYRKVGE